MGSSLYRRCKVLVCFINASGADTSFVHLNAAQSGAEARLLSSSVRPRPQFGCGLKSGAASIRPRPLGSAWRPNRSSTQHSDFDADFQVCTSFMPKYVEFCSVVGNLPEMAATAMAAAPASELEAFSCNYVNEIQCSPLIATPIYSDIPLLVTISFSPNAF